MDLEVLKAQVEQIRGCTFANLDALCTPKPGISQRITGERVIIFRTKGGSGYENMVKRHLEAAGKDPESFKVGPLPWGERLGDLPIIVHHGKYYLQTIELARGKEDFFLTFSGVAVNPEDFGIKRRYPQPNLPPNAQVRMHTYNIENIERIALMGETLIDPVTSTATKATRTILKIRELYT